DSSTSQPTSTWWCRVHDRAPPPEPAVAGADRVRADLAAPSPADLRRHRHRTGDLLLRHAQPRRARGRAGCGEGVDADADQRIGPDHRARPGRRRQRDRAVPAGSDQRRGPACEHGVALHHGAEPARRRGGESPDERAGGRVPGGGGCMQRGQPGRRRRAAADHHQDEPGPHHAGDRPVQRRARHPHRDRGLQHGVLRLGSRAQRGQAIVLVAVMVGVVVGMAALAIDGSRAYTLRRDMQNAADYASLAAADSFQRTGSYSTAESTAATGFGTHMRLYAPPSCTPFGAPGPGTWTVTCTYSDGTTLVESMPVKGAQGAQFMLTATQTLALQFGRILTNGTTPQISATAGARVGNLLYSPAVAALDQAGCGGAGGTAVTINGTGSLKLVGDLVSDG